MAKEVQLLLATVSDRPGKNSECGRYKSIPVALQVSRQLTPGESQYICASMRRLLEF